jgi:hypothetical protein
MLDSFYASSIEYNGFGYGAKGFGCAFKAGDALMVAHRLQLVYGNVHGANDGAYAVIFTGGFNPPNLKDAKEVGYAKRGAVRAGIFAPGSFNKNRKQKRYAEDDKAGERNFRCPKIEERKIGVVVGKDQRAAGGCNIDHPG